MKKISIAVLAVLILSGCTKQATQADQSDAARGKGRNSSPEASQSARPARSDDSKKDELKFKLESLDSSRREGTVTFTSMGAKTKVMIELKEKDNSGSSKKTASPSTAATSSAAMPAHIHLGSCPKPGEVKYPLTKEVNSK